MCPGKRLLIGSQFEACTWVASPPPPWTSTAPKPLMSLSLLGSLESLGSSLESPPSALSSGNGQGSQCRAYSPVASNHRATASFSASSTEHVA